MSQKKPDTGVNVKIRGARLSFPHLFQPYAFEDGKEPSFSATFILDKTKDAASVKVLQDAVAQVKKAMWPNGAKNLKGECLRQGSEKMRDDGTFLDGYSEDVVFVSAGSKTRVPIVDQNPNNVLVESDGKPYAGCYVNATIRIWGQDDPKWGRRVNAQLKAVQFASDGKPFGQSQVDPTKEFEDVTGAKALESDIV